MKSTELIGVYVDGNDLNNFTDEITAQQYMVCKDRY